MKTFKDLEFKAHPIGGGVQARMDFDNGYGVSVVRFPGSYTSNDQEWEVAVMKDGGVNYDSGIANDVLGYQLESDVTEIMKKVQELK